MQHTLDTKARPDPAERTGSSTSPIGGLGKRCVDLAIACTAVVLLSPLLAFIALAIKLSMGGPVIYSQLRVGYNGQLFRCFKFRSMSRNADKVLAAYLAANELAAEEWSASRKLKHDPRITPLGAFLRRSSLDELPQLFNVVRGDMSCVGPRPIVADELALYGVFASEYLRVRPGVTGLWQIAGRNDLPYGARVALDSCYVRSWSHASDFIILLKTIPAVLSSRGCY
jgi:exopolysaccharide production protein ExoY